MSDSPQLGGCEAFKYTPPLAAELAGQRLTDSVFRARPPMLSVGPAPGLVLLFPCFQSCLFDLSAKANVPRRQDVKGGEAELLWQVRVLPHRRHVGRAALMQQSADGNGLLYFFLHWGRYL